MFLTASAAEAKDIVDYRTVGSIFECERMHDDQRGGWQASFVIDPPPAVDYDNQKEDLASIKIDASPTVNPSIWFQQRTDGTQMFYDGKINVTAVERPALSFWLYLSDKTGVTDNAIRMFLKGGGDGSLKPAESIIYRIDVASLTNGWNKIVMPIYKTDPGAESLTCNGVKMGYTHFNTDFSALNVLSIDFTVTKDVTVRYDAIRIVDLTKVQTIKNLENNYKTIAMLKAGVTDVTNVGNYVAGGNLTPPVDLSAYSNPALCFNFDINNVDVFNAKMYQGYQLFQLFKDPDWGTTTGNPMNIYWKGPVKTGKQKIVIPLKKLHMKIGTVIEPAFGGTNYGGSALAFDIIKSFRSIYIDASIEGCTIKYEDIRIVDLENLESGFPDMTAQITLHTAGGENKEETITTDNDENPTDIGNSGNNGNKGNSGSNGNNSGGLGTKTGNQDGFFALIPALLSLSAVLIFSKKRSGRVR